MNQHFAGFNLTCLASFVKFSQIGVSGIIWHLMVSVGSYCQLFGNYWHQKDFYCVNVRFISYH